RSVGACSPTDGSVPSLTALRNEEGVVSFRPSARAMYAKMLSEAPTGVPAYFVRIPEMRRWYSERPVVSKLERRRSKYGAPFGSTFLYSAVMASINRCTPGGEDEHCVFRTHGSRGSSRRA